MYPLNENMWWKHHTPILLFCSLALHACDVEQNDYPLIAYRNATDLQFQAAASFDNYDVINDAAIVTGGGQSAVVRSYAQVIVNDRLAAQSMLKSIADSASQQLPQQPETGDMDLALRGISGAALDTSYLRESIMDQDSAISIYQGEIANGSYSGLLHYANQWLPVIQARRATADSLLQVLEK